VELLLASHADPSFVTYKGQAALMIAREEGHDAIVVLITVAAEKKGLAAARGDGKECKEKKKKQSSSQGQKQQQENAAELRSVPVAPAAMLDQVADMVVDVADVNSVGGVVLADVSLASAQQKVSELWRSSGCGSY
jgi:hypothetical protein